MSNLSLLSNTSRIETPYIAVTIGDYQFGYYGKEAKKTTQDNFYKANVFRYPNYIKSLTVTKINGQVNQYQLSLNYPVTQNDDPNFFEKVFSSVSIERNGVAARRITFSYGDMSNPNYIYKEEQAIITKITTSFGMSNALNSVINYNIYAVSSAVLATSGNYDFFLSQGVTRVQPSKLIKDILANPQYGLQTLFYGMNDMDLVLTNKLIADDDQEVNVSPRYNISPLEAISYLVSCMVPNTTNGTLSPSVYTLIIRDDANFDEQDRNKDFNGPYFKVVKSTTKLQQSDAYELDIGYPTSNIVTSFSIENDENYSLYYEWDKSLNTEHYTRRLNDEGKWEEVYSPSLTSTGDSRLTLSNDRTWWTKLTQYPIKAKVTIRGLLRPAILMTHVRLRMYFPGGQKHISSGLYVITQQIDMINESGYSTQLSLTRIAGDED